MRLRHLATLIIALVVFPGWTVWIHRTFGVELAWQAPKHIVVCDRRYKPVGQEFLTLVRVGTVLDLRPTVFELPVPLPDLRPFDSGLPYGGCPAALVLHLARADLVYAPLEGGP